MFRFTIRDVLWLTVVVALGAGWWTDHSSLAEPAAKYRSLTPAQIEAIKSEKAKEFFDMFNDVNVVR
jgi:hypothetical protein